MRAAVRRIGLAKQVSGNTAGLRQASVSRLARLFMQRERDARFFSPAPYPGGRVRRHYASGQAATDASPDSSTPSVLDISPRSRLDTAPSLVRYTSLFNATALSLSEVYVT